jgi:hypothetical protein
VVVDFKKKKRYLIRNGRPRDQYGIKQANLFSLVGISLQLVVFLAHVPYANGVLLEM